jgi:hypothetical protein
MRGSRYVFGTLIVFVAIAAWGCSMVSHKDLMLFGTDTKFALDVSAAPENGGTPQFTLGYKRREFVWMPLLANGEDSVILSGSSTLSTKVKGSISAKNFKPGTQADSSGYYLIPPPATIKLGDATQQIFVHQVRIKVPSGPLTKNSAGEYMLPVGSLINLPKSVFQDPNGNQFFSLQEAKFIGEGPGKTKDEPIEKDTYSVLASFGAQVKSGGTGTPGVGIAQFFSTGIAARRLAEQGGSDLVTLKSADQEVVSAQKKTIDVLTSAVGEEKANAAKLAAKDRFELDKAKIELIVDKVSDNKTLNKSRLDSAIDDASMQQLFKDNLKKLNNLDDLRYELQHSSYKAVKPLFKYFYKENK